MIPETHRSWAGGWSRRELLATIARLERGIAEQDRRIAALETELTEARRDFSTSSKPPSSDIVKPPKSPAPEGGAMRTRGGQPGHPKHGRPPFPSEMVGRVHEHRLEICPDCGLAVDPSDRQPLTLLAVLGRC